jgi:hypothetical protein
MMSAGSRRRTYDDATMGRWADALRAGASAEEFERRFGLSLGSARKAAIARGCPLPFVADAGFGGKAILRAVKAPQGAWKR